MFDVSAEYINGEALYHSIFFANLLVLQKSSKYRQNIYNIFV